MSEDGNHSQARADPARTPAPPPPPVTVIGATTTSPLGATPLGIPVSSSISNFSQTVPQFGGSLPSNRCDYDFGNPRGPPPLFSLDDLPPFRSRTLTSRGRQYQLDTLSKRSTITSRRIKQQVSILDSLQHGIDKSIIKKEVKRLEDYMMELEEITSRLVDTTDNDGHARAFEVTLEEFEAIAIRAKQDAYKLLSESSSSSTCSSRSSRKSMHSKSSRKSEDKVRHWLSQSEHSDDHPGRSMEQLRSKLNQKVSFVSDLEGGYSDLMPELRKIEYLHEQLAQSTVEAVDALPSKEEKNVALAELNAADENVSRIKERLYTKFAGEDRKSKGGGARRRHASDLIPSDHSSTESVHDVAGRIASMEVEEKEKRKQESKTNSQHLIAKANSKKDELEAKMAELERQRLQVEALKKSVRKCHQRCEEIRISHIVYTPTHT